MKIYVVVLALAIPTIALGQQSTTSRGRILDSRGRVVGTTKTEVIGNRKTTTITDSHGKTLTIKEKTSNAPNLSSGGLFKSRIPASPSRFSGRRGD